MDLQSPNRFAELFVQAGQQAGFPINRDFNGATQEGVGLFQVTHKNGERFSAAKAYLTPHLTRPNLTVFSQARATRVVLKHQRATGVEFLHEGQLKVLSANREVLLCAGALQSPQILMLSGIGPKAHLQEKGVALAHDLPGVGQHLHDHPDVVQVVSVPRATELFGVSATGLARAVRGAFEWRRSRTGLLTTNFAEAGGFIKSHAREPLPDLQLHFVVGKLLNHGRTLTWGHGYSCHVCLLRPQSRGSVRLASNDPLAAPLIDPNFLGERDDLDRLVRGFKLMRYILSRPVLAEQGGHERAASAKAETDAQIEHYIRAHADTIYHPVGSCRMGPGPLDVVDAQLKVHGIEGLRVVDAAIMPRIVGGNTNAPVIMVAEKAADLIKSAQA